MAQKVRYMNPSDAQRLLKWQLIHDWAEQKEEGELIGYSCTDALPPCAVPG